MNVCPGEGVAYDSYYNETDHVTSNQDLYGMTHQQVITNCIRLYVILLKLIISKKWIPLLSYKAD